MSDETTGILKIKKPSLTQSIQVSNISSHWLDINSGITNFENEFNVDNGKVKLVDPSDGDTDIFIETKNGIKELLSYCCCPVTTDWPSSIQVNISGLSGSYYRDNCDCADINGTYTVDKNNSSYSKQLIPCGLGTMLNVGCRDGIFQAYIANRPGECEAGWVAPLFPDQKQGPPKNTWVWNSDLSNNYVCSEGSFSISY
jgi:hypothetical protein